MHNKPTNLIFNSQAVPYINGPPATSNALTGRHRFSQRTKKLWRRARRYARVRSTTSIAAGSFEPVGAGIDLASNETNGQIPKHVPGRRAWPPSDRNYQAET